MRCDPVALGAALHDQQLLALLGARALEHWGDDAPQEFREAVEATITANRGRALALEALSTELASRLDAAGIPALVLKGPLLARRLHGDVGFRRSNDVDLLVDRGNLTAAVGVLQPLGYNLDERETPPRSHGLPDLHLVLRSPNANLPRIDLHWRVHWYEEDFSAAMLARSRKGSASVLEPEPNDDLATLMLLYARDGFYGLRTAVDIAAWTDQFLHDDSSPLERHWREHSRLRLSLTAAALAAQRAVGIRADRLVSKAALSERRSRLAANLASWNQVGEVDQLRANVAVVDALLSPRRELRHFARREVFVTRSQIELMYMPTSSPWRIAGFRMAHVAKVTARFAAGLWSAFLPPRGRSLGEA